MDIQRLREEFKKDTKLDDTFISKECVDVSLLHSKYVDYFSEIKTELLKHKRKKKKMIALLESYYNGDLNGTPKLAEINRPPFQQKLTKTSIANKIEVDPLMDPIEDKIDELEIMLESIIYMMDEIKWRGQRLSTALEHQKFISGQ